MLGQLKHQAGEQATGHRVAHTYRPVGHGEIQQRQRRTGQRNRRELDHRHVGVGYALGPPRRRAHQPRTQRQAATHQQGADGNQRPINQHALQHRPLTAHAPDVVERIVDGDQQHDGGDRQKHDAHRRQLGGIVDKLLGVFFDQLGRFRHDIVEDEILDHVRHAVKHRKRRQQRHRHGNNWHQRQQGGKGQTRRRLQAVILLKAPVDHAQQLGEPRQQFWQGHHPWASGSAAIIHR